MKQLILIFLMSLSYGFNLKYKTLKADFNQSVKSDNKVIIYRGNVFVKNNLIFWHYKEPIEKKIWVNKEKIYIYEPDLEQITIHKTDKKENFFQLIKSAKQIEKNKYLKYYNNKNIYFTLKDNMISQIYYKDKIDNIVTLNFYNLKNEQINDKIFIPNYPKWVDIIYTK